jgi:hypothetical protein
MEYTIYTCPRCGYNTPKCSNIRSHIRRKKLCKLIDLDVIPSEYEDHVIRKKVINVEVIERKRNTIKKEEEIERLNQEIERLNQENERLNQENEILREESKTTVNNDNCVIDPKIPKSCSGYLYVFYNPQFGDNVYKIGCSNNPWKRMEDFKTSYPEECIMKYNSHKFDNKLQAEKHLFKLLNEYRISNNREFFKVPLRTIINNIENTEKFFNQ